MAIVCVLILVLLSPQSNDSPASVLSSASPSANLDTSATADAAGGRWIQPMPMPLARSGAAVAYDPLNARTILFGGNTVSGLSYEMWTYQAMSNVWREWNTLVGPSSREGHAMATDLRSGIIVLFGGRTDSGLNNETWVLDPTSLTWTKREPIVAPSPRERQEMTYDADAGRIVLFGG